MAVGLLRPDAGRRAIFGVDVWADTVAAKALIGVLPDGMAMPERLTGARGAHLPRPAARPGRATVAERADELLAVLELDDAEPHAGDRVLRRHAQEDRSGDRAAARARSCWCWTSRSRPSTPSRPPRSATILQRFVAAGGSVVISSHVMALVEQLCDHVAVIAGGRVVAAGPLAEVRGDATPGGGVRRPRRRRAPVARRGCRGWRPDPDEVAGAAALAAGNQAGLTAIGALVGLAAAIVTILVSAADFHAGRGRRRPDRRAASAVDGRLVVRAGVHRRRRRDAAPGALRVAAVRPAAAGGRVARCRVRRGARDRHVPGVLRPDSLRGDARRWVVAIVVVPLQLVFVVLLSRVVMAALGRGARSRRGRDLGVLLAALVGLSGFVVQGVLKTVGPTLVEGRAPMLSTVLQRCRPAGGPSRWTRPRGATGCSCSAASSGCSCDRVGCSRRGACCWSAGRRGSRSTSGPRAPPGPASGTGCPPPASARWPARSCGPGPATPAGGWRCCRC